MDNCFCARVKRGKQIDLLAESWIPDYSFIDDSYTRRGYREIQRHERKRRDAMRRAYREFLVEAQGRGDWVKRCGWICRDNEGEAEQALREYLDAMRTEAIARYDEYNMAQQRWIGREVAVFAGISPWLLDEEGGRRHKLRGHNDPTDIDPPEIELPDCPPTKEGVSVGDSSAILSAMLFSWLLILIRRLEVRDANSL